MSQYRTKQGDTLDRICKIHYGDEVQVHDVLEANPRLARYGVLMPAGLLIELPEIVVQPEDGLIRLWD